MFENQLPKFKETTQTLRTGQIIQGRILKLYQNNKANIQLGTQQLIAQLEASLEVGEKYHFQVHSSENVIHLKVLGDALTSKSQANIIELFQQLGIKATKVNQAFVRSLLENKTPFDKGQLHRAVALLDGEVDKGQAQNLLRDMIAKRVPITDSIFHALLAKSTGDFSERIKALELALQQNPSEQNNQGLLEQLQRLTRQVGIEPQVKAIAESRELFDMMKALKIINQDAQFMNWGSRVKNTQSGNYVELNQLLNVERLQNLFNTMSNTDLILQNATTIVNKFGDAIHSSIANNIPLPPTIYTNLMQEVEQKILPLLHHNNQLVNTPQQLQYLLQDLETLSKSESYHNLDRFVNQFIKELFVEQSRNVLQNVGLQYEKAILHDENNPANTLKGTLLTLIQSGDGNLQDQANKLLQFINGLQLQSVNETDKFVQANLLIPAGKLGLAKDAELTFEGKKNDKGEVDPNYCRIVFYLELATIKKTVVDMHIQKRAISLTVLNDNPVENTMRPLKSMLKDGLEKINYHLSSVTIRPLTNKETIPAKNKPTYNKQQAYAQGVDFRV